MDSSEELSESHLKFLNVVAVGVASDPVEDVPSSDEDSGFEQRLSEARVALGLLDDAVKLWEASGYAGSEAARQGHGAFVKRFGTAQALGSSNAKLAASQLATLTVEVGTATTEAGEGYAHAGGLAVDAAAKLVTDAIAPVKLLPGYAASKDDIEKLELVVQKALLAKAGKNFKGAVETLDKALKAVPVFDKRAKDNGVYLLALAAAEKAIEDLKTYAGMATLPKVPKAITDACIEPAKVLAAGHNYADAGLELAKVAGEVTKYQRIADDVVAYETRRPLAETEAHALDSHSNKKDIGPNLLEVQQKLDEAAALATPDVLKYREAKAKLDEIPPLMERAKSDATCAWIYDLDHAKAKTAVEKCESHFKKTAITTQTAEARQHLTDAENLAAQRKFYQAWAPCALAEKVATAALHVADLTMFLEWAKQEEDKLDKHPQKAVVAGELAAVTSKIQKAEERIPKKMFKAALELAKDAWFAGTAALKVADAAVLYVADLGVAQPLVTGLATLVGKEGATTEITKATATLEAAKTKAAAPGRKYASAQALLKGIAGEVAAAKDAARAYLEYTAARTTAEEKLEELNTHAQKAAIADDIKRIGDILKEAAALSAATPGKHAAAKALVDGIPPLAAAALKAANAHVALVEGDTKAKGLTAETVGQDPTAAIANVQKMLDALNGHAQKEIILAERTEVGKLLTSAGSKALEESHPFEEVRTILVQAAGICIAANLVAIAHDRWFEADKVAKAAIEPLRTHTQKVYITKDVEALDLAVAAAKAEAGKRNHVVAMAGLLAVHADVAKALDVAAQHGTYVAAATDAENARATLANHTQKVKIAAELLKIKTKLEAAATHEDERRQEAAMTALKEAQALTRAGHAKAEMFDGQALDTDKFKDIIDKDGPTALDTLVDELGDDPSETVLKPAVEARFGLKLTLDNSDKVSVKKIYTLLAKVPSKHATKNKSLLLIEHFGNQKGSGSYSSGLKRVKLTCGRASDVEIEALGKPGQLEGIEEAYQTRTDNAEPKQFDFTALHEVGHAVDDRKGFMKGKEGDADFGGWEDYGKDVARVAAAVASHFKFDTPEAIAFIEELLAGGTPASPPLKVGVLAPAWLDIETKIREWVPKVRHDSAIWYSAAESKARALGDRVYQEAYENQWVSYLLAARSKGVTGYQFRAPGEWLAELYAAYHTEKLKPENPANIWLAKL